jgi:hypothetical protein
MSDGRTSDLRYRILFNAAMEKTRGTDVPA